MLQDVFVFEDWVNFGHFVLAYVPGSQGKGREGEGEGGKGERD